MKINLRSVGLAISQRSRSIGRKLPILIVATFACYSLSYLDYVKNRFDEGKARPLLIDENFKTRIESKVTPKEGGVKAWRQIGNLISVNQYSTEENFINKSVDQISRAVEAQEFVAQAAFKGCVAKALLVSIPGKGSSNSSPGKGLSETQEQPGDPQKCSDDYIATHNKSYSDAQDRIASVYRYLKPLNLKEIRTTLDNEELESRGQPQVVVQENYLETSFQPILDEKTGLYVIYQIFRISCVVIIVFTLIAFGALLLRALLLTDGVRVLTEQATAVIGGSRSVVLPNIAKTAIMSVAALGVGTAVVAGVTINNKADQALAQLETGADGRDGTRSRSSLPGSGAGTRAGNGPGGTTTTAHYDSTNAQYDYARSESNFFYSDNRTAENSPSLPPVVQVFPRINVEVPGATRNEVGLDPDLTAKMKRYFESQIQVNKDTSTELVNNMRISFESLNQANKDLSSKLAELIVPTRSNDVKVANQDLRTPLLIDFQAGSDNLRKLNDALEDLQRLNLDTPLQPKGSPTIRGWLFGSNRYFMSKRAATQLKALIKGKGDTIRDEKLTANAKTKQEIEEAIKDKAATLKADDLISKAMELLYINGGKPLSKKELLKQVETVLLDLVNADPNPDIDQQALDRQKALDRLKALERLKLWSDTILTYTQVS